MRFANHHAHATNSYLDGIRPVEEHVKAYAALGYESVTLGDHGNVSGHIKLEKYCQEAGVKPIFAVEAYCETGDERGQLKHHLTILAENEEGYRNLNRLVSSSWKNFKYKPTVTSAMLQEFNEGLIVLSGCMGGLLADKTIGGKLNPERTTPDMLAAHRVAGWFAETFPGRYYLEVMPHPQLKRQRLWNTTLAELGARMDLPLVATLDTHYPTKELKKLYPVIHAIGRGGRNNTVDEQSRSFEYDIDLYPKPAPEVFKNLRATGLSTRLSEGAMASSIEIADRCNVKIPKFRELKFPGTKAMMEWPENGGQHGIRATR